MRFSLFLSIVLHLCIFLLITFGIPFERRDLDDKYAITVDVVSASELSNLRNATKAKPKVQKQEDVKTLPKAAKQEQPKPKEAQATKKDAPKPEVKPEAKEATPENAEVMPQKQAPPVKKQEEAKPKESKSAAEKPKKEKPKKQEDDFAQAMLKTLEASKSSKPTENKKIKKQEEEVTQPDEIDAQTNREYNPDAKLSLSEKDRVKSEIKKNWNMAAFSGSKEAAMRVKVIVKLDPLGNIISVTPQLMPSTNSSYQAFVSSIVRAVKRTNFSSFLSPENYQAWDELELNFDSSGMIY